MNVRAGLPNEFTVAEYKSQDKDFFVDLMLSSGCLISELIIFCTGLTMFRQYTTYFCELISDWHQFMLRNGCVKVILILGIISLLFLAILVHTIGTITLSYFVLEEVDSYYFWWVFGFCTCAPISLDIFNLLFHHFIRD